MGNLDWVFLSLETVCTSSVSNFGCTMPKFFAILNFHLYYNFIQFSTLYLLFNELYFIPPNQLWLSFKTERRSRIILCSSLEFQFYHCILEMLKFIFLLQNLRYRICTCWKLTVHNLFPLIWGVIIFGYKFWHGTFVVNLKRYDDDAV